MSLGTFKVPNHKEKEKQAPRQSENEDLNMGIKNLTCGNFSKSTHRCGHGTHGVNTKPSFAHLLVDRRVTRGSIRAWQEGCGKVWGEGPNLRPRLGLAEACSTSDYGTASENSTNCSQGSGLSPSESCKCDTMSGIGCLLTSDDEGVITDDLHSSPMSTCAWNSDSDGEDEEKVACSSWEDPSNFRLLEHPEEQVFAIIPLHPDCSPSELKIRVLESDMYKPQCGICMQQVSPVVSMEPHGIEFRPDFPVYLSIPVNSRDERHLVCLFSNTQEHERPRWERLPKKDYVYRDGFLIVIVNHFSLFTVLVEEPYPEIMKRIRRRTGGTLRVDEVPGVEVTFPRGCLDDDVDAYLRVLYDSEPTALRSDLLSTSALASPIIMLGPHGHQFDPCRPPVIVTLPVPDLEQICRRFCIPLECVSSSLSVMQSSTVDGEPVLWERLDTNVNVDLKHPSGVSVVSFQVHHFSFFSVIWDVLSASLYEAKMGMANYYPYITFSMMCEAFMQETPNTNRFGLEVICHRSDRRLPDKSNLIHRVGSSVKPKFMKPGRILVRLKSQMFEADEEAGEDVDMAKEEPDFRGRDFEKQYACRFKADVKVDVGIFGKVLVEKIKPSGKNDLVIEFNLYKTGHETEPSLPDQNAGNDRWTIVAIKELAANLQITEDNNWKKFAQHIGFTKSEIRSKLQMASDPFMAMMTLYNQRGGTPEEFVQSLFAVNREIRLNMGKITPPSSSHGSPSPSRGSSSSSVQHTTPTRGGFGWFWKKTTDSDTEMPAPDTKRKTLKRSHPSSGGKNSSGKMKAVGKIKPKRRKQFSDISETATNSSSGEADEESGDDEGLAGRALSQQSSSQHRLNPRKLSNNDMWPLSACMAGINWRALGRTLGIEESMLLNIEHSYKGDGVRECVYRMLMEWRGLKPRACTLGNLYTALNKEKMNSVAKQILQINFDQ